MPRALVILAVVLLATAACAEPSAEESRLREVLKRTAPVDQDFLATAKYAGQYRLSQLVNFSNRDGRLLAAFHLPAGLVKQMDGTAPVLIRVEGSPHAWAVYRRQAGTLDDKLSLVTLACYAPDLTWPFNRFTLSSDGTGVMVSAAQTFGQLAYRPSVSLNQGERQIHLAWRTEEDKFVAKKMALIDASQLPTRVPNLYDRYLVPAFRQLGPGLAASDVYRVFDQIPADPKVARAIVPLVGRLAVASGDERDAALAALRAMGRPAILATLRLDAATLSPEQRERLAGFQAADGWYRVPDLDAARRDMSFLVACLTDEDPAVRSAAEASIAAMRAAQGIGGGAR
ncbi:MAG TPA: hypothetical protein VK986_02030 [Tepidisphaeraceae bacterium]|nr:hypothetical protein [Tepidisphaeraceae bacterium]